MCNVLSESCNFDQSVFLCIKSSYKTIPENDVTCKEVTKEAIKQLKKAEVSLINKRK